MLKLEDGIVLIVVYCGLVEVAQFDVLKVVRVIVQVVHAPVEAGTVQVVHVLVIGTHVVQALDEQFVQVDADISVDPIIELSQIVVDVAESNFSVKVVEVGKEII
jgi:hypothetical protein